MVPAANHPEWCSDAREVVEVACAAVVETVSVAVALAAVGLKVTDAGLTLHVVS
jgi:hypothetical protein